MRKLKHIQLSSTQLKKWGVRFEYGSHKKKKKEATGNKVPFDSKYPFDRRRFTNGMF